MATSKRAICTTGGDASGSKMPGSSGPGGAAGAGQHFNRLGKEKSPYLLQHAANPVNWYPWGEEAFKAATEENKLIFLSVGYSTCHWCHVMERESFEDPKVADVMNRNFINVKVDREERPDVDKVYMTFVTSMSGSGGWPMSVWLTPDLHPIYGGTYFPPDNRYFGRPGFVTVLEALAKQWNSDEDKIRSSGRSVISVLVKSTTASIASSPDSAENSTSETAAGATDTVSTPFTPAVDIGAKCVSQLSRSYEPEYGGFSSSPKFPQPCNFNFLFSYYLLHPDREDARRGKDMALHTLTMMARGGIHDHVAQGFARYSTDDHWHVPHFEKMLYDQAQLVHAYLDAFLVTGRDEYSEVVRDILEYVTRDLSDESGGFYSAEDADSFPTAGSEEKREGAFCVWTKEEIHTILAGLPANGSCSDATSLEEVFCHHYGVEDGGNVDPHKDPHDELKHQNVLLQQGTVADTAAYFGLSVPECRTALEEARRRLYERRQLRPRPHRDEKMLAAWNGMMLSALSRAGAVLRHPPYLRRAEQTASFLTGCLTEAGTGRLYRVAYRGVGDGGVDLGSHPIPGFCDDYAWCVRGLLQLYDCTLQQQHLTAAKRLQLLQDNLFWDAERGGYFSTRGDDPAILLRMKDDQDGAEPSVNSVSAGNLLRLSRLLDRPGLLLRCRAVLRLFSARLSSLPIALPEMAAVAATVEESTQQVILSGDPESDVMRELVSVVHNFPHPNRVLLVAPPDPSAPLYTYQPALAHYAPKPASSHTLEMESMRAGLEQVTQSAVGGEEKGGDVGGSTVSDGIAEASGDPSNDSSSVLGMAKAYVCHNFVCSLPVTEPEELRKKLERAFEASSSN